MTLVVQVWRAVSVTSITWLRAGGGRAARTTAHPTEATISTGAVQLSDTTRPFVARSPR